MISQEELRAAFFDYGGESIYEGIYGSYTTEKKYCAAYDYLNLMSSVGVRINPMPPHPGTLTCITTDQLFEIETDLGIIFSMLHGGLCAAASAAFQ